MDDMTTAIVFGLCYGTIGFSYFIYGKKQHRVVALASGMALMGLPYVSNNPLLLLGVGLLCFAAPILWRV